MRRNAETATVTLNVNGRQAKQMMSDLEAKVRDTEKAIKDMKAAGADPKDVEKARKQLTSYKKDLTEIKSATEGVKQALGNLDTATPRQLEKALRTLNKQLKDIPQGSELWDSHIKEIKKLKTRLSEIREELTPQQSLWEKFKGWINDSGAAILALGLGLDQAISTLRGYVDTYAEMEQEMANVRKFTGMSAEEVESLNDKFKTFDTRSSREQLNKLAQEAGRLGKTSEEDILGFVRAADQINVALDDLGAGATLILSKLTGIFGDEQRYGTEQALLKVGSVINELSQNCSAAAPYLSNFTERMGGVGAQAGLTIPQIMGFGAVLDSNAQKVEASATALSQIIVRLYQDPAKYAKVAGLEAKSFSRLMREDANSAILLFLDTLQKAGGMDVLSPMFKDMGENGSRAIAALSTLATHIDQVKAQQEAANIAFEEGTSITTEFNVQNNTVQAYLDKCKIAAHELQVELGERLYPLMSHFLTTGSAIMRALLTTVRYLDENKAQVVILSASVAAYVIAVKAQLIWTKAVSAAETVHYGIIVAKQKATGMLTVATTALQLVYFKLTRQTQRAIAAQNALKLTMASTPWGAVAAAVTAVVGAVVAYASSAGKASEANKRVSESSAKVAGEIKSERKQIDELFTLLTSSTKGTEQYRKAKDRILSQYGAYLQGLGSEVESLNNVAEAYRIITREARNAAKARGLADSQKAADDAFNDVLTEKGGEMYDLLKKAQFGKLSNKRSLSEQEIARWMSRILDEASGEGISTDVMEFLRNVGVYHDSRGRYHGGHGLGGIINDITRAAKQRDHEYNLAEVIFDNPDAKYLGVSTNQIHELIADLEKTLESNYKSGEKGATRTLANGKALNLATNTDIADAISELKSLVQRRLDTDEGVVIEEQSPENTSTNPTSHKPSASEIKAAEKQQKIELAKAKAGFKAKMEAEKASWEEQSAENLMYYAQGERSYEDYLAEKERLDMAYVDARAEIYRSLYEGDSSLDEKMVAAYDEDYKALLLKQAQMHKKQSDDQAKRNVDELRRQYKMEVAAAEFEFSSPLSGFYNNSRRQQQRLHELRIEYLMKYRDAYQRNSKEWADYERQISEAEQQNMLERRKELIRKYEEFASAYTSLPAKRRYEYEKSLVDELYRKKKLTELEYQLWLIKLREQYADAETQSTDKAETQRFSVKGPGGASIDIRSYSEQLKAASEALMAQRDAAINELQQRFDAGLISEELLAQGINNVTDAYYSDIAQRITSALDPQTAQLYNFADTWATVFRGISDTGALSFQDLAAAAQASYAVMSTALQTYSEFVSAQTRIDVARTEKRYDREIELAQGNSYKVAKLEKQKEAELQKIKAESNRKQFAVKVVMAIAQTAQNALMGYAAGLEAGFPAALWLAPLLAGLATAQGAIQIALIKKQQQAASAEGYSKGGFTKPGAVNEPAGVVHAGEWVASQKLLANPVARPMIEALDYAQRTNTIGSLKAEDVSRSIRANDSLVRMAENDSTGALVIAAVSQSAQAVSNLTRRLDEPFVTVNTVTGDKGIKQAQDDYDRLMRNVTPKRYKK